MIRLIDILYITNVKLRIRWGHGITSQYLAENGNKAARIIMTYSTQRSTSSRVLLN